jgi:hypothetical protein
VTPGRAVTGVLRSDKRSTIAWRDEWQRAFSAGRTAVSALYDDTVRRLMAKISFNYLAHVAGAAYALKREFNAVRDFIRYGRGRGADLAGSIEEPMLFEEQSAGGYSITEDHLVGVARIKNGGLLGQVSLFNQIHHVVLLTQTNPDIIETG